MGAAAVEANLDTHRKDILEMGMDEEGEEEIVEEASRNGALQPVYTTHVHHCQSIRVHILARPRFAPRD